MISTNKLSFRYSSQHEVLTNITLRLEKGHIHGLLGCNGIGKTTLLKLVCGIMRPNGGEVSVMGCDPSLRRPEIFRDMIIIPEEFDLPNLSLDGYAKVTAPFYPRFNRGDMYRYCEELHINPSERLHSMSMGQRKKAYIAFAMACNVAMLLLDEPTNGLDIPSKSVFRRILASYVNEERMVVISTHQVADIEQLLDSIVILDEYGVALSATTLEIGRRLKFGKATDADKVIYSERTIQGDMAVSLNETDEDTPLSIELLFNATTANRNAIAAIFNTK
ncbi:MAG: ABC transporter ATP-binding protein [Alistipes sp.]|nr:ABC transporter ATP-binding protein [Alistipes sp.]